MAKGKKSTYVGALEVPLQAFDGPYFHALEESPTQFEQYLDRRDEVEREKLALLLQHYDIDKNDDLCWFKLSLCLARAHVPGFQFAKKSGRVRKWSEFDDALAKIAIDHFISGRSRNQKLSVKAAASYVAKQPAWAKKIGKGRNPGEVLRRAYFRATDEVVKWLLDLSARRSQGSPQSRLGNSEEIPQGPLSR